MGVSAQAGGRITSPSNPKIKWIRRLKDRRERDEAGLFWIEGLRIVAEAIQLDAGLDTLVVAPELLTSDFGRKLVEQQAEQGLTLLEVSGEVFKSLSLKEGPRASPPWFARGSSPWMVCASIATGSLSI